MEREGGGRGAINIRKVKYMQIKIQQLNIRNFSVVTMNYPSHSFSVYRLDLKNQIPNKKVTLEKPSQNPTPYTNKPPKVPTTHIAQNIAETCQKYFESFIAIEILPQHVCQLFQNISLQH